ncbi:hypothetical protein Tco_1351746 [Tanacetum coccineum]
MDDRESQLYDEFETLPSNQREKAIQGYYDSSVQQYPTHSSKSPQPTKEPSPADNFQRLRSSSQKNLIKSLSNTLPSPLNHTDTSFLKTTQSTLEHRLMQGNKAMVQDGKVVVQMSVRSTRLIKEGTFQRKTYKRKLCSGNGNVRSQNRGHIAREFQGQADFRFRDYFKDKMYNASPGEWSCLDEETVIVSCRGYRLPTVDDDLDDFNENDLALNVDHFLKLMNVLNSTCVDEVPTSQTMFMANLTTEDPIYDEAGHIHMTR